MTIGKSVERLFSMQEFVDWAAARSPDETYNYTDSSDCAFARYLKEMLPEAKVSVGPTTIYVTDADGYGEFISYHLPRRWNDVVSGFSSYHDRPGHTMRDVVYRAKMLFGVEPSLKS